jgi:anti-anti-sigma factor
MPRAGIFEIEREGETGIFIPVANLRALEHTAAHEQEELQAIDDPSIKNLIIDCCRTDYFGSSALAVAVGLWKVIQTRGGRMALCNLSEQQREILNTTRLDKLWLLSDSREAALTAVRA